MPISETSVAAAQKLRANAQDANDPQFKARLAARYAGWSDDDYMRGIERGVKRIIEEKALHPNSRLIRQPPWAPSEAGGGGG